MGFNFTEVKTMDIADVTVHIDETLDHEHLVSLSDTMHDMEGVISVGLHDNKPHLMIVGYDPKVTKSRNILDKVTEDGMHAELIGL